MKAVVGARLHVISQNDYSTDGPFPSRSETGNAASILPSLLDFGFQKHIATATVELLPIQPAVWLARFAL